MKAGFDPIPRELEAAAMMDGASLFQTLRIIILPLAAPVIATAALFAFLLAWDEFFYALLFTSDLRSKTLTVAIADLAGGRVSDYGMIATAGVIDDSGYLHTGDAGVFDSEGHLKIIDRAADVGKPTLSNLMLPSGCRHT